MDELTDRFAAAADTSVLEPGPVDRIERRAGARFRRRWAGRGLAGVAVLGFLVATAAGVSGRAQHDQIFSAPGTTAWWDHPDGGMTVDCTRVSFPDAVFSAATAKDWTLVRGTVGSVLRSSRVEPRSRDEWAGHEEVTHAFAQDAVLAGAERSVDHLDIRTFFVRGRYLDGNEHCFPPAMDLDPGSTVIVLLDGAILDRDDVTTADGEAVPLASPTTTFDLVAPGTTGPAGFRVEGTEPLAVNRIRYHPQYRPDAWCASAWSVSQLVEAVEASRAATSPPDRLQDDLQARATEVCASASAPPERQPGDGSLPSPP